MIYPFENDVLVGALNEQTIAAIIRNDKEFHQGMMNGLAAREAGKVSSLEDVERRIKDGKRDNGYT